MHDQTYLNNNLNNIRKFYVVLVKSLNIFSFEKKEFTFDFYVRLYRFFSQPEYKTLNMK